MGKVIGIDLRNHEFLRFHHERRRACCDLYANAEGARTTPSVVAIQKRASASSDRLRSAEAITNPENTIFSVKRLMGRKFRSQQVTDAAKRLPYKVTEGDNGDAHVELRGKRYSPPEISAMILQKMKQTAEDYLGEKVTQAVITVPAYFDDSASARPPRMRARSPA